MWTYVDGTGLWQKYKNEETGEESLKEHTLKNVYTGCAKHRINPEIPRDRQVVCLDCGQQFTFVVGYHLLKDGYLHTRH